MPPRARTLAAASAALGGAILLVLALVNPARDRAAPDGQEERTASALADARLAGASTTAPLNLAQAEEAYAEGLLERRRQELRPGLLRDFRRAHELLSDAEAHATRAISLAESVRHRARTRGVDALVRARTILRPLDGVEERLWLPDDVRGLLLRARAFASEGGALSADGQHAAAEQRAVDARAAAHEVSRSVWNATGRYVDEEHIRTWRTWVAETVAWSKRMGKAAIVIDKDEHRLTLYQAGRVARTYDIELGWNNAADKRHQGDGATPEGRYKITELKGRGRSRYHRALLLDYPNRDDLRTLDGLKRDGAVARGVRAGGLIEIHGAGGRGKDWTDGCVAVTNEEIEELYARVSVGTPVTIIGSGTGSGVFAELARNVER